MTIHVGSSAPLAVGAVALLVIVAVAVGWIPLSSLLWLGLILLCPLMMFVMMRGMHSDESGHHHRMPE